MTDQLARQERLEIDNGQCQLSKLFGIAQLSGVPCHSIKEVHHITYERYSNEDPEDLITVCKRCHKFLTSYIRELRYGRRNGNLTVEPVRPKVLIAPTEGKKRNGNIEVSVDRDRTNRDAQWTTGRPSQQMDKDDLRDLLKKTED